MKALLLALAFGWTAPEVLPGDPPISEYKVYLHNTDAATTNIIFVAGTETETPQVDESLITPGRYEIWVTASNEQEYSNTVSGIHTVTTESARSEQLWINLPMLKPTAPSNLLIGVEHTIDLTNGWSQVGYFRLRFME